MVRNGKGTLEYTTAFGERSRGSLIPFTTLVSSWACDHAKSEEKITGKVPKKSS